MSSSSPIQKPGPGFDGIVSLGGNVPNFTRQGPSLDRIEEGLRANDRNVMAALGCFDKRPANTEGKTS